jgi:hypothetical protein
MEHASNSKNISYSVRRLCVASAAAAARQSNEISFHGLINSRDLDFGFLLSQKRK